MIEPFKRVVRRHWPPLRLRTILLATFLFVAALPGFGALFLRVYENALVRQTEAELIAQGTTLSASAAMAWPGARRAAVARAAGPTIDLRLTPILPARPAPRVAGSGGAAARAWARRMRPLFRMTAEASGTEVLLLDARGIGPAGGGDYGHLAEVRAALAGRATTVLRRNPGYDQAVGIEWLSRASDLRVDRAVPVVTDGRVVGAILLSRPPAALFAGLHADRGKIAIGVLAIFATLVILSGLLSRGLVRPVEALGRATRAVAGGGGTVPEPPTTAAIEIQALYRDFGVMAAAIAHRSRYLRDFAHAVSHEFKTPLAGIAGAVELLQDHPDMPAADRERFLANAAADAARLALLVSRLLDLARADMAESAARDATDVGDAARRVADALFGAAFAIDLRLPTSLPPVAVPQDAVEAVLTALAENGHQAGATSLVVVAEVEAGGVVLSVSDDGPGIPPGDRDRVFEPFFTSRRTTGGTGLGLPIARSLLEAHGGTIALDGGDDGEGGAAFRIILPVRHAA